jgi:hypothetical protein
MSCGWTGLALLHGMLEATGGAAAWGPSLLALGAPTYYGMLAATFVKK